MASAAAPSPAAPRPAPTETSSREPSPTLTALRTALPFVWLAVLYFALRAKQLADERRLATVTPKFEGYVERLYVNVTGQVGFRFFGQFILDCLNRTENAMTQAHAFKAAELCLRAQLAALDPARCILIDAQGDEDADLVALRKRWMDKLDAAIYKYAAERARSLKSLREAVEAGSEAAKRVGELVCSHIIARPHGELIRTLGL